MKPASGEANRIFDRRGGRVVSKLCEKTTQVIVYCKCKVAIIGSYSVWCASSDQAQLYVFFIFFYLVMMAMKKMFAACACVRVFIICPSVNMCTGTFLTSSPFRKA